MICLPLNIMAWYWAGFVTPVIIVGVYIGFVCWRDGSL